MEICLIIDLLNATWECCKKLIICCKRLCQDDNNAHYLPQNDGAVPLVDGVMPPDDVELAGLGDLDAKVDE